MSDLKFSIADLQRAEREMLPGPWDSGDDARDGEVIDRELGKLVARLGRAPIGANTAGVALLRSAAPVLLEIAVTGVIWANAEDELRLPSSSVDERIRRSIAATHAFDSHRAALAKVRP